MSELRMRRRWAPWMFGLGAGCLGVYFGYFVIHSIFDPKNYGQGIRVIILAFFLACYWLVAIAFNMRTALVTADRVRVTV